MRNLTFTSFLFAALILCGCKPAKPTLVSSRVPGPPRAQQVTGAFGWTLGQKVRVPLANGWQADARAGLANPNDWMQVGGYSGWHKITSEGASPPFTSIMLTATGDGVLYSIRASTGKGISVADYKDEFVQQLTAKYGLTDKVRLDTFQFLYGFGTGTNGVELTVDLGEKTLTMEYVCRPLQDAILGQHEKRKQNTAKKAAAQL